MGWRWLAVLCAIAVVLQAVTASAQPRPGGKSTVVVPPGSTPVLTFESDDAEEQADAFTTALRAKIKATPGWTLSENTFSLGILTAALKCRMDAPCLLRVGDQLKTDKFFWGKIARIGKTQVTVEAHYWQRGKHDSVVKETYPDDLRDPKSEALQKIVTRVFERLTGTATTGTVAVTAGRAGGTVIVDGAVAAELSNGQAVLELKPGTHVIEVRAEGYQPVRQSTNVVVGAETQLNLDLVALGVPPTAAPPPRKLPTRRLLAYGLIGAGAIAGAIGIGYGIAWYNDKAELKELNQYWPKGSDPCTFKSEPVQSELNRACDLQEGATGVSAIAWVAGGMGAALVGSGVVLLVLDAKADAGEAPGPGNGTPAQSPSVSWSLAPSIGPRGGGLHVGATF